jgi:hypothetical protein
VLKNYGLFAALLLLGMATAPAPAAETAAETNGSIAGRVVDAQGRPIAGAELAADFRSEATAGSGGGSQTSREQRLGTTGEDGTFHIDGLGPGSFDLVVRAAGYVEGRLEGVRPEGGRLVGLRVVLSEGARIEGLVLDQSGAPAAGVTIAVKRLGRVSDGIDPRKLFRIVRVPADRAGRYRVSGLEPGRYRLTVEGSADGTASAEVDVRKEDQALDFRLAPAQEVEVSGTVVDEAGQPFEGVEVSLVSHPAPDIENSFGSVSVEDGSFTILRVPAGEYRVAIQGPGVAGGEAPRVQVAGAPVSGVVVRVPRAGLGEIRGQARGLAFGQSMFLKIEATSPGQPARSLNVGLDGRFRFDRLPPGTWTLRGTVGGFQKEASAEVAAGKTADLDLDFSGPLAVAGTIEVDGRPLSGARLTALSVGGSDGISGRTGEDGSFHLEGLTPGVWSLVFVGEDGRGTVRAVEVPVVAPLALKLSTGSVEGQAVDASTRQPLAGATVTLIGLEPTTGSSFTGPVTRTDARGRFRLSGIVEGRWEVKIEKSGSKASERLDLAAGRTARVEIALPR